MKIIDTGVLESSFMEFSIPSEFTRRALYYCPEYGHFCCDEKYDISRNSLDLFLMMYICSGSLTIETRGRTVSAGGDQIVLLDCRTPHRYFCHDSADFLWFHFNGSSSADYADYLFERSGPVFYGEDIPPLKRNFYGIFSEAQAVAGNQHRISIYISELLGRLADSHRSTGVLNNLLRPAIDYIRSHYNESIDLDQLAALCSISKPHLIRCFKKNLHCTPHEYLLSYRLLQAKQYLLGSSDSVESIAEQCGFHSASHFTRAFRSSSGITPSAFRSMQF